METLTQLKTGSPEKAAMASMYEQTFQNFEEGSVIEGTVLAVKKDAVIVDIGYKSEGIISAEEFTPQELAALTPGTRLPVYIEEREDSEGNLVLSKEKADKMKDRKSTRLNSSHSQISYAVFCLKKKKKKNICVRLFKQKSKSVTA